MNSPSQANYLLIDGALRPDALVSLYQRGEALEIEPLYLGTRWDELKDLGPILVSAQHASNLISEWQQSPIWQADTCLLFSRAPLRQVAEHWRRFIAPPDVLGGNGLLRFADPRVMHHWLSSYPSEQLSQVMGPVERMWINTPPHSWNPFDSPCLTSFSHSDLSEPRTIPLATLSEEQLTALEQAYHWQFKEQLYEWLNQRDPLTFTRLSSEQIERWLEYVLSSGNAWGLVSERALVIWAETCVDWGKDFATRPQGPYQDWLDLNPEHASLAPELRIEALDDYRQHRLGAKDTAHD
ncbi:DUF4123 domain-containing protein [Pseudomonas sp. NFPP19]|uniref:DUF4123 domain-containing protein n=1 Tax=Pseudomonas sp. NFPP19 TaxID=1566225 RepID=UPI0008C76A25|nr:DUF4123 domain-containing protein [Pseudomonas sp. NFPP19]SES17399.1 protein of unknown function [Pseudomonas sp. NFPP19]